MSQVWEALRESLSTTTSSPLVGGLTAICGVEWPRIVVGSEVTCDGGGHNGRILSADG